MANVKNESLKCELYAGKFPCSQCDYKCETSRTLKFHTDEKHKGILYLCEECDYKGTRKTNLVNHIEKVHELIRWPCDMCSFTAFRKSRVKSHKQDIHYKQETTILKGEKENYGCEKCEYNTNIKRYLINHQKARHSGIFYFCNACNFKGAQKGHLT